MLRRPLVFLIKSEIELHHHVQGYTSEGQQPGAPAKGPGIRQRQKQVGGVGASRSQQPASRGLPPQDGSQDSQPQGGVPSPQPASKAWSDGSGGCVVRPPDLQYVGEGANRKAVPKKNRPPPTKALAICLNTPPNIQNQPPARNIRLRVAHRAAKGGARARRLSQAAKNMEVIDKENQREPRRVKTEKGGEVKVLIIGATGSTGRILLEKALEQGHEVTALARNPSAVAPREYRPRVLGG